MMLNIQRERAIPTQMTGTINETYFQGLEEVCPCLAIG
jgi:hypothetical protein